MSALSTRLQGALNLLTGPRRDPMAKERRGYLIRAYPPLLAACNYLLTVYLLRVEGLLYEYPPRKSVYDLGLSRMCYELPVQGISRSFAKRDQIVHVKLSSKTRYRENGPMVDQAFQELLETLEPADDGEGVCFRRILATEYPWLAHLLQDRSRRLSELQGLMAALQELQYVDGDRSTSVKAYSDLQRERVQAVQPHETYYPSRGDMRGYYSDACAIRQFVGDFFRQTCIPTAKDPTARLQRAYGERKDMFETATHVRPGEVIFTLCVDLSSATHNAVNLLPLLLLKCLQILTLEADLDHVRYAQCRDRLVRASVSDILLAYLFLTAFLPVEGYPDPQLGGCLGVKGNIELFLELQVFMLEILTRHPGYEVSVFVKPGGDDTFLWIKGARADVLRFIGDLWFHIATFMGHCGVLTVREIIPGRDDSNIGSFCRKNVQARWNRSATTVTFSTPETLPLPLELLFARDVPDEQEHFRNYALSLLGHGHPAVRSLLGQYLALFEYVRGPVIHDLVRYERVSVLPILGRLSRNLVYTYGALRTAEALAERRGYLSFLGRGRLVRFALVAKRLTVVRMYGSDSMVVCTRREAACPWFSSTLSHVHLRAVALSPETKMLIELIDDELSLA